MSSRRPLNFVNTNALVHSSYWEIDLSKTGYISQAGRCLVMHVRMAHKDLIVVLLNSSDKRSRIGDANRIRVARDTSSAPLVPPTAAAESVRLRSSK